MRLVFERRPDRCSLDRVSTTDAGYGHVECVPVCCDFVPRTWAQMHQHLPLEFDRAIHDTMVRRHKQHLTVLMQTGVSSRRRKQRVCGRCSRTFVAMGAWHRVLLQRCSQFLEVELGTWPSKIWTCSGIRSRGSSFGTLTASSITTTQTGFSRMSSL